VRQRGSRVLAGGLSALALLAPALASAAESLQDAWAMALGHDPALAAAQADAEAATAGERAARAGRLPRIEATGAYTRYDTAPALSIVTPALSFRSPPIFDADDTVMAGAQLTLPIYTGGALSASIRAARLARTAAEAIGEQTVADLRLDVAERYVGVLRARRARAAAEASVTSLAAHVADVEAMVSREMVASSDLLAARVALANATQQGVRATNGVQLAEAAYNRRLGQPLDRVPDIEDRASLNGLPPETRDLPTLLAAANANRSELRALEARAGSLEAQGRAERAKLLPQFSLQGGWQHLETTVLDREEFSSVGVGFRWTLFDGGQALNQARALERAGRAARLRRDDAASLLELQVREAWLGLSEAEARRAATREAVEQAAENLRISRELYGAGLASNTQVLDAIALRVAAENNRDDAAMDIELARLRVARAIGEL
jgi:outer membrane protein TolC